MPLIPLHTGNQVRKDSSVDTFNVLVTGFGPFSTYEVNPSWLAVKPLHNTILFTKPPEKPVIKGHPDSASGDVKQCPIHISVLQVPVTYEAVLELVPGLHARPPILPDSDIPFATPELGYDFIFHIGVAGRGPLRMERLGHKLGYYMKDATGKLAPIVHSSPKDFSRRPDGISVEEVAERERLGIEATSQAEGHVARPSRGFGPGYEKFSEELMTDLDVTRINHDLKRSGVEEIYSSMDAGHYLCDFIYYCSLAEAKRNANPYEKPRNTKVLFLHCPPVNQPLSTEEVSEAIRRIIVWVCSELQLEDEVVAVTGVALTT